MFVDKENLPEGRLSENNFNGGWIFGESVGAWFKRRLKELAVEFGKIPSMESKLNYVSFFDSLSEDSEEIRACVSIPTLYRLQKSKDYFILNPITRERVAKKIGFYGYSEEEIKYLCETYNSKIRLIELLCSFSSGVDRIFNKIKDVESILTKKFLVNVVKFAISNFNRSELYVICDFYNVTSVKDVFSNEYVKELRRGVLDFKSRIDFLISELFYSEMYESGKHGVSCKVKDDMVEIFYKIATELNYCYFCYHDARCFMDKFDATPCEVENTGAIDFELPFELQLDITNKNIFGSLLFSDEDDAPAEYNDNDNDNDNNNLAAQLDLFKHTPPFLLQKDLVKWQKYCHGVPKKVRQFYMTSHNLKRYGAIRPLCRSNFEVELKCCDECFQRYSNDFCAPLSYLIRKVESKFGLSQEKIANELDIKQSTVSRMQNGEIEFADSNIVKRLFGLLAHGTLSEERNYRSQSSPIIKLRRMLSMMGFSGSNIEERHKSRPYKMYCIEDVNSNYIENVSVVCDLLAVTDCKKLKLAAFITDVLPPDKPNLFELCMAAEKLGSTHFCVYFSIGQFLNCYRVLANGFETCKAPSVFKYV